MVVNAEQGERSAEAERWIECGEWRVRAVGEPGGPLLLGSEVRRDGMWEPAAPAITPLVTGLDLRVAHTSADRDGLSFDGVMHGATAEGQSTTGIWQGTLSAEPTGWVRIEIMLDLADVSCAQPELVFWLGSLETMHERQFATFRQTRIASPTVNTQELMGNDLPATFFHDPTRRIDTMVYVPAQHLTWTARRFLAYRCDLTMDRVGKRYGVGLVSADLPALLSPGQHRFVWFVRQRAAATTPSEWEAQRDLLAAVTPLFERSETPPVSWESIAAGATADLLTSGDMQIEIEGHLGHPAYVRDTSLVRAEDRRPRRLELMTQIDIIPPLALYLKLNPDPVVERHLALLMDTVHLFHHPEERWVCNFYPARHSRWIEDLWYFFENALIKLPWTAAITARDDLWEMFLDALSGATELAHNVRYIFPLFADVATKQTFGSSTNYSVGGMYAYGHLLAYERTGLEEHLDEASAALATLARLPLDRMWHEPQQLGFAAAAAANLADRRGDPAMRVLAEDLLAAQLRMAYWDDRSPAGHSISGMFQACASLLYPAFKENVECLLPWPLLLRAGVGDPALLMRVIDAQRRHNGTFFQATQEQGSGVGRYIPLENLGTVELPGEGRLGKEIYGAGEVFWLYLLLEALATTDDPEVMVCSLDLPSLGHVAAFPPAARCSMVFNSGTATRKCMVTFRRLQPRRYVVQVADGQTSEHDVEGETLTLPVEIEADGVVKIRLEPVGDSDSSPFAP